MTLVTLTLSCKDITEANKISQVLLEKHLIACAKTSAIESTYWWQGKIEQAAEILLIMESALEKFAEIEVVVKELHSYELFVLQAHAILKTSTGVETWLKETLSS